MMGRRAASGSSDRNAHVRGRYAPPPPPPPPQAADAIVTGTLAVSSSAPVRVNRVEINEGIVDRASAGRFVMITIGFRTTAKAFFKHEPASAATGHSRPSTSTNARSAILRMRYTRRRSRRGRGVDQVHLVSPMRMPQFLGEDGDAALGRFTESCESMIRPCWPPTSVSSSSDRHRRSGGASASTSVVCRVDVGNHGDISIRPLHRFFVGLEVKAATIPRFRAGESRSLQ